MPPAPEVGDNAIVIDAPDDNLLMPLGDAFVQGL
jgi:hypothetical protein